MLKSGLNVRDMNQTRYLRHGVAIAYEMASRPVLLSVLTCSYVLDIRSLTANVLFTSSGIKRPKKMSLLKVE